MRFALILFLFVAFRASGQIPVHLMKASYIMKISKYISWDDGGDNHKTLLVIEDKILYDALRKGVESDKTLQKRFKVIFASTIPDSLTSEILILGELSDRRLTELLLRTQNDDVLLVSEQDGAAEVGVHINFIVTKEGMLQFEINRNAFESRKMNADMMLYEVASRVY